MCLQFLFSLNAPVVFLWKPRGQLSTLGLCFIVERGADVPWELRNASWSFVYTKLQWRGNVTAVWKHGGDLKGDLLKAQLLAPACPQ